MPNPLYPNLTRRRFTSRSARTLTLVAVSGSLAASFQAVPAGTPAHEFRVWATSDAHVGTDLNQLDPQREDPEARLERIGEMLAAETLRLYRKAEFHSHIPLGHTYEDLQVKVRLPEPKQLVDAQKFMERIKAGC